jgi:replicative DNA helicase
MFGGGEKTRQLDLVLDDTLIGIEKRTENPGIVGVGLGIDSVDNVTGGASGGELWIVAGRPGSGKTAHLCNWILNAGKLGKPSLVIEREMRDTNLAERLLSIKSGIPIIDIKNGLVTKDQLKLLKAASDEIRSYPIYIDTDTSEGFEYSIATSKRYIHNKGVKLVLIDYIQLEVEREENQTQELGSLSRKLKRTALGEDVTFVAYSQLNRLVELRDDKRPRLSDLRQCGNLEEDADIVIGFYRPHMYEEKMKNSKILEHIILKFRNGPTGTIPLDFIAETNRIMEHKRQ